MKLRVHLLGWQPAWRGLGAEVRQGDGVMPSSPV
jgi:hypothetical protein